MPTDAYEPNEFEILTHRIWRAGLLNSLSPAFARGARRPVAEFLGDSGPILRRFFSERPTRDGEYLMLYAWGDTEMAVVMTNLRLWVYDKESGDYQVCETARIEKLSLAKAWKSFCLTVHMKGGAKVKIAGLANALNMPNCNSALRLGRERDLAKEAATIAEPAPETAAVESVAAAREGSKGEPRKLTGIWVVSGLVGVLAGSLVGAGVSDYGENFIGLMAMLGGLIGELIGLIIYKVVNHPQGSGRRG